LRKLYQNFASQEIQQDDNLNMPENPSTGNQVVVNVDGSGDVTQFFSIQQTMTTYTMSGEAIIDSGEVVTEFGRGFIIGKENWSDVENVVFQHMKKKGAIKISTQKSKYYNSKGCGALPEALRLIDKDYKWPQMKKYTCRDSKDYPFTVVVKYHHDNHTYFVDSLVDGHNHQFCLDAEARVVSESVRLTCHYFLCCRLSG
jgi:hypothetical protein